MADYKITNYEDYEKLEQARLMLKQELDAFMPDYSKVQQIGCLLYTSPSPRD